jgi:hypothetical protein
LIFDRNLYIACSNQEQLVWKADDKREFLSAFLLTLSWPSPYPYLQLYINGKKTQIVQINFLIFSNTSGSEFPICSAVAPERVMIRKKMFLWQARNGPLTSWLDTIRFFLLQYPDKDLFGYKSKNWNFIVIKSICTGTEIKVCSDSVTMCQWLILGIEFLLSWNQSHRFKPSC